MQLVRGSGACAAQHEHAFISLQTKPTAHLHCSEELIQNWVVHHAHHHPPAHCQANADAHEGEGVHLHASDYGGVTGAGTAKPQLAAGCLRVIHSIYGVHNVGHGRHCQLQMAARLLQAARESNRHVMCWCFHRTSLLPKHKRLPWGRTMHAVAPTKLVVPSSGSHIHVGSSVSSGQPPSAAEFSSPMNL